jgi:hypothetical protein
MDLPNYFLADLPESATLSPQLISEACSTLKQNRERFLSSRSTESIISVLVGVARDWLQEEFPFRKCALKDGPPFTGFASQTLAAGLDAFFGEITTKNIEALLAQDLGSSQRLDQIVSDRTELREERASIARGPELLVQITGGLLPNPTLMSMMLGLLARSAQFIKCASGTAFIPRMFAHSLYAVQPKLGSCLEIAEWKGGNEALETALFSEANCVTATGSDETLTKIRSRLPSRVRFLGYGHKLSFTYIARESLAGAGLNKLLSDVTRDVVAWNQLGCLSPHVIYTETGGDTAPDSFAEMLGRQLEIAEAKEPRGPVETEVSAAITTRRMVYEARASQSDGTRLWMSPGSTAWTVVFEEDPQFQISCLNRFVYVKPTPDLSRLLLTLAPIHRSISTVGLSAPTERLQEIAIELARWGVTRICRPGTMQHPPLTWRHDGRPSLGDLITWTDVEF